MITIAEKLQKYLRMSAKSSNFVNANDNDNRRIAGDEKIMHTILIVDDEPDIREILAFN